MQGVILAAGVGKRMHPLTLTLPKPLIEVAGRSILTHILDALPEAVDEIILVVGYRSEQIRAAIGNEYNGISVRYVEQGAPLGTYNALSAAAPLIQGKFLLMNADDIHGKAALEEAVAHPLSILVARHAEPQRFGVVSLRNDGTLEGIIEKPERPPTDLISTGAMVLDERIFAYPVEPSLGGEYLLTDPLALLAADHPIQVIEQDLWLSIGYPEDIAVAEGRLRGDNIEE